MRTTDDGASNNHPVAATPSSEHDGRWQAIACAALLVLADGELHCDLKLNHQGEHEAKLNDHEGARWKGPVLVPSVVCLHQLGRECGCASCVRRASDAQPKAEQSEPPVTSGQEECTGRNREGLRCVLVRGHDGDHANGVQRWGQRKRAPKPTADANEGKVAGSKGAALDAAHLRSALAELGQQLIDAKAAVREALDSDGDVATAAERLDELGAQARNLREELAECERLIAEQEEAKVKRELADLRNGKEPEPTGTTLDVSVAIDARAAELAELLPALEDIVCCKADLPGGPNGFAAGYATWALEHVRTARQELLHVAELVRAKGGAR